MLNDLVGTGGSAWAEVANFGEYPGFNHNTVTQCLGKFRAEGELVL